MHQTARAVAVVLLSGLVQAQSGGPAAPAIHPVDSRDYTDARQWAFLSPLLDGVEVVSLGEPIHMTHEFPLVRLGIIEHLNEHLGFHVVAMEGSVGDAWVAQDRFLASAGAEADARDAQLGLFGLWNTPEIRRMFEYESASWRTATPLYITAYDIQPGTGRGTPGELVFREIADRLRAYGPAPVGFDVDRWVSDLSVLTHGCNTYSLAARPAVVGAIGRLEAWIGDAAPVVAARFPAVPHAAVLRLLPDNLRASLALCDDLSAPGHAGYKATRDRHAAEFAQQLKAAMPGRRLVLWAHLSHLFYNAEAGATSVGQQLHAALGTRLYTIMPLAEKGGAIVIYADDRDDVGYGRIHGDRGELGQRLSGLSATDYFLDLRDPAIAADPVFASRQPVWIEAAPTGLALSRDVDAIVWIKTVHAPDFPLLQLAVFGGLHYQDEIEALGGVLVVAGVGWPLYRWVRRRRRAV